MEKDINEVKYNNKMLKDENNKLNKDNMDLKIEIESIKNNSNNSINGLQIQINNIINMINQIKQQLSQFYNIVQQINQNQINSLSMSNNSPNLNNQLSLNNINENNNFNINVIFRWNLTNCFYRPVLVLCKPSDNINEIIKKFREKIDYYEKDIQFIFNARFICRNISDTIENYGITNNSNIFVLKLEKINFVVSNGYFYVKYFRNTNDLNKKFSETIKEFLSETGINASDIKNYIYNLVDINPNQTLEECNIKNDSNIIVELKRKSQIKYVNIIFQDDYNNKK